MAERTRKMAKKQYWRETNRTPLKDVVPLDTPYSIAIEVSSLCNIGCIYCAHSLPNHGVFEGNMQMELFYKVVEDIQLFSQKIKLIETFAFGEPLCNPNLAKMIEIIRENHITEKINFTTNGLLFTKQRIDAILQAGVDTIRISLQGLNAEMYERLCGVKIDFEKFIDNLAYLYANRGKCKIRMKIPDIALKGIAHGQERTEEVFGDIADSIFVEHILPMYQDMNFEEIDSDILDNAMNGRANIAQDEIHTVCHRPFYRLKIAANGIVSASCCDDPHDIRYGDIHEKHLTEIWNHDIHRAFLKMQLMGKRFQHPICKNCVMPNDITTKEDILDPYAKEILKRFL